MKGRLPDISEECTRCGAPFGERARSSCKRPYNLFHICGKHHGRSVAPCQLRLGWCLLEDASAKADRLQVRADAIPIDAHLVQRALRKLHDRRNGWELFPEFQLWTRRVDALAVRLYNSGPPIVAYEIKVERGDFLAEMRSPDKRAEAEEIAAECWFAAPKGLIAPEELPEGWGLVEVRLGPRGGSYAERIVPARQRPITQLPLLFVARMLWRMGQG